ncbi:nucleotide sugar dehydrogenase [Salinisphaera sp. Q1T1-3]|uniref:nucleotide sugar dehydrogenase n=1 Tax=Salinisphaera sp. Q1T1-3 TaxID=2321229 RepID=UPI000E70AA30|nr:nucleotide sugar dehydrogenase [Salinisphaera sp. Q1T1-3]RJS94991.1 nucleotide sugar dehydrogenase [Salinisphaera sp. Q1T1-3]
MDLSASDAVAVIGLGYVGLPLAVAFGHTRPTIGFDVDEQRVAQLRQGHDRTREVTAERLAASGHLSLSADSAAIAEARVYIVTVPTPVTEAKVPNFGPLENASRTIAPYLREGDIVVYESTVYPGATEERCVPLLEAGSGLCFRSDFHVGYSPERANPGDVEHTLSSIVKIVGGSSDEATATLADLYGEVVTAGVHTVSSIAVAEAAKVIENIQRDINVALVNELAQIFSRLQLPTDEILRAAGTKWNFLPFKPGLVGGHCIGVDPYYLTYRAQAIGYHPEMILAGRRINDGMGRYISQEVVRLMLRRRIQVNGARILVMGLTFKENCPDTRNTRVVDIVHELRAMDANVDVFDPWVSGEGLESDEIQLIEAPAAATYDAIIVAVAHREFIAMGIGQIRSWARSEHVIYDVKSVFPEREVSGRL